MPLAIKERAVIFRSETGRIMLLWFQTLHPVLTLDGFEDVLNQELQRDEAVIHSVISEWALLRAWEWMLLESTLPATQIVDGGTSVMWLRVLYVIAMVERLVCGALHPTGCTIRLST